MLASAHAMIERVGKTLGLSRGILIIYSVLTTNTFLISHSAAAAPIKLTEYSIKMYVVPTRAVSVFARM